MVAENTIDEIRSRIDGRLLSIVFRAGWATEGRTPITDPAQLLQLATIRGDAGREFAAHRHLPQFRETRGTQECWLVLRGSVQIRYYDIDNLEIESRLLSAGDLSLTVAGGHAYELMANDTFVYEFKSGPYTTKEADKVLL